LGTKDGKVHFVTKDGKELRTTSAVSAEVSALAWSNDGRTLAIGSSSGEIVAMDAQDMRVIVRKKAIDNTVSKIILDKSRNVLFVGYDTYTLDLSENGVRHMRDGSSKSRIFCFDIETGNAKWSWPIDAFQGRLQTVPESIRAAVSEALRGSHQMSI